ncbi:hypothetical protein WA538_001297, partial [Blastocystis sp. DL]
MNGLLSSLRSKGLNLKPSWVDDQLKTHHPQNAEEFLFKTVLQSRLSVCSDGLLQTIQTPSKCYSIQSPIVLEIRGITNIANPKDSQFEDSSNRMLKLELTDGVTSCYAIEFARVPSLSATLKSGTKLSVSNVRVENGYLLLNPSNTFLLGG